MKEFRTGKNVLKREYVEKKLKKAIKEKFGEDVDICLNELIVVDNDSGNLICKLDVNAEVPKKLIPKKFLDKYLK